MFLAMRFLLDPLELGEQELGGILDERFLLFGEVLLALFDEVGENGVVDRQSLHRVQLLD